MSDNNALFEEQIQISSAELQPKEPLIISAEPLVLLTTNIVLEVEPEAVVEPVVGPVVEPIIEAVVEPLDEPLVELIIEAVAPETLIDNTVDENAVPKLVFIVPYRDRVQQQHFFSSHMSVILEDIPKKDYKIYFVHQTDSREFNRGAMKNIGFIAMKNKYPNDYKNMTFVFNDVDTMPFSKNFLNYETTEGVVKHFYGYTFALGGIVSIKGCDYEKALGFPNFWAWGYEDNMLQNRVLKLGIQIDRSQFYHIMDKNIFQMKDGITRIVNRAEFDRFAADTTEGWNSIHSLEYTTDENSGFINVSAFETGFPEKKELNQVHDLRTGSKPFQNTQFMPMFGARSRGKARMTMHI